MRRALLAAALCALPIAAASSGAAAQTLAMPKATALPQPGDRCYLPPLPPKPLSARLLIARKMLDGGNPDLVAIAQEYLDKGLDEQFQIDVQRQQLEDQRAMVLAQRGCPPQQQ